MALWRPIAALFVLCLWGGSCARNSARSAQEEMEACVPEGTIVLAGVHLDRVRGSALFQKLSGDALAALEPVRDADSVLVAYNGSDLVLIGHGKFPKAPAGATLITPKLAVAGTTGAVQAALRQRASGQRGTPDLVIKAQPVSGQAMWAVVVNTAVTVQVTGYGRSADAARQLEETVRSFVSLAAATTRDRDVETLLKKVMIAREGTTVRMSVVATTEEAGKIVGASRR